MNKLDIMDYDLQWEWAEEQAKAGKWILDCPSLNWRHNSSCPECEGRKMVAVDPVATIPPCDWGDHKWEMVIEEGRANITCLDPHTPLEQEAMRQHDGKKIWGACSSLEHMVSEDIFIAPLPITISLSSGYDYWGEYDYEYTIEVQND